MSVSVIIAGAVKETAQAAAQTVVNVWKGFDWIMNMEVLVGIPDSNSNLGRSEGGEGDDGGGLSNAQLMYLHTNGSPINRIPPRPVIEPALNDPEVVKRVQQYLSDGIGMALSGDIEKAERAWAMAGQIGATAAQEKFGTGAPNAPITVNGGWMRNHSSGKPVYVKGKGSSAPLIDTGSLRKSITYVIRRKK